MEDQTWLNQEAQKSLERILPLFEENFVHRMPVKELVVLANFTEREQTGSENQLFEADEVGVDLISDTSRLPGSDVILKSYQFIWIYV